MHRHLLVGACAVLWPAVAGAQAKSTAVFAGRVVDSAQNAIPNAEVALPGLSIVGLTTATGDFRLEAIPAGSQRVTVRRLGYGQLDTTLVFAENQTLQRVIQLGRVTILDSVMIDARKDPLLVEFEENRARGMGRFLTRADLAKMEGRSLGNAMTQMSGLEIVRGRSGQGWVAGKRGPMSRCQPTAPALNAAAAAAAQETTDRCLRAEGMYYVPEANEQRDGLKRQCYAQVYLDRSLLNSGRPTTPFDLNSLAAIQIEAIEWYESPAQVPIKYKTRESMCGVMIVHTRR